VIIGLLLVVGDAARFGAVVPHTSAAAEPTISNISELSIDTGQMNHLGDTRRYNYVILQEYMYSRIGEIKRANPRTKVLAYLEAATVRARGCGADPAPRSHTPHDSFAVDYCYAARAHPEWFLHNSVGRHLAYADYPRYMVMDVGNRSYQRTWIADAIAAARSDGFDGVYLDDVNTYPGHGIGGQIAEYTDRAYGRAMTSFVVTASTELRASGLVVAANVAANPWIAWQRAYGLEIASHLSAYVREHYSRYGDICGPFSERFAATAGRDTPPLADLLTYDRAVQAAGAHLLGIDYGYSPATATDLAAAAYGRAVFLLAWDGRAGGAYVYRPCGPVDPASASWTLDLGAPTTAAVLTGAVYRRSYSHGLVFLNPSRQHVATISIPAGYVDAYGAPVSRRVELAPLTALLLRSAN
jgi:hypothetical protein